MSKVEERLHKQQFSRRGSRYVSLAIIAAFLVSSFFLNLSNDHYISNVRIEFHIVANKAIASPSEKLTCSAPLPTLLASHPPGREAPGLKAAAQSLDEFISIRAAQPDIDSLSLAVVTANGAIFEAGYGVRANESEAQNFGSVSRNSIYRIASITKMFTVLETLILRERGILNWDDPVTKFLPNFTYPSYGWSDFLAGNEYSSRTVPITLRQLASHLSGIGRDYPPLDVGKSWPGPLDMDELDDKATKSLQNASSEALLEAIAKYPLVAPQYTFPIYSNTGFNLLGMCNLAANALATQQSTTYREFMQNHIFEPLGLNSSFYQVPNRQLAAQIAVPRSNSEWADITFQPVDDPSGGQYSSLADLTTLMQSFLSPEETGVISPYVVREWLRPLHPWSDGNQEVGAPWEISKVGREARMYSKGGNLPGYHSQFVLNPQWSYGVIVLVTGNYTDTVTLAREAISRFQPAFEKLLLTQVLYTYGGVWFGVDSIAVVTIEDQALYIQALVVGDRDVLSLLQRVPSGEAKAVALWSTGRPHEFRLAIGRPELNDNPEAGCEPYWISIDPPFSRGAPLDLLYWDGSELVYPSAGVRLRRE
ncbi:beta-lactamase/transpeptidase-like protein [Mycena crocata]|nr:beta-lactamase/transpeptidase-like protein [Mycena crocata]